MKTIIKLLPLCLFVLAGTSCIKDEITKEYITENNTYIGVQNYVYDLTVRENDWQILENDQNPGSGQVFYSCSFNVPGLTQYVYDYGQIVCYQDFNGSQQMLPVVRHHDDGEFAWTETTDFELSVGSVTIYFTSNDFADVAPSAMFFRLVLTYDSTQDPDFKENR